jgi:hypothetical protein
VTERGEGEKPPLRTVATLPLSGNTSNYEVYICLLLEERRRKS